MMAVVEPLSDRETAPPSVRPSVRPHTMGNYCNEGKKSRSTALNVWNFYTRCEARWSMRDAQDLLVFEMSAFPLISYHAAGPLERLPSC